MSARCCLLYHYTRLAWGNRGAVEGNKEKQKERSFSITKFSFLGGYNSLSNSFFFAKGDKSVETKEETKLFIFLIAALDKANDRGSLPMVHLHRTCQGLASGGGGWLP